MNKTILFASLLALAGASSVAAAADDSWFVRGELGQDTMTVKGVSGNDSDTAASIRGGYYFTENFAVEGSYTNYGNHNDNAGNRLKTDGWGLGIVGKKNFGPNNTGFFIDGRVGVAFNHTKLELAGVGSSSQNTTKPYFGVGAGYDFNRNFGVGVNWDYTQYDANVFGLGSFNGHISTVTGSLEARF
ncbi:MAG: porin family protein [Proteobacteria bacterium]|nr:porin family protein [Pseudomonadota bacterium]